MSASPSRALRLLSVLAASLLLAAVFLTPRMNADLYVALAGGRDVLHGQLGRPDQWSFSNIDPATGSHRVWVNQGWLSDVAFYLAYRAAGDAGLLLAKAVLLLAAFVFLTRWSGPRRPAADRPISLLVAAAMLTLARPYIDIRPNLVGLMLLPLVGWLITRAVPRHRRRIWIAVPVVWLWSCAHGSFPLGIAMLVLYALCQAVHPLLTGHRREAVQRALPPLGAAVVATLLCAVASPFGPANLIQAARVRGWQEVNEWTPIFTGALNLGSAVPYLVVILVLSAASLARVATDWFNARRNPTRSIPSALLAVGLPLVTAVQIFRLPAADIAAWVRAAAFLFAAFAAVAIFLSARLAGRFRRTPAPSFVASLFNATVAVLLVVMANASRRFIPLALIALTPPLVDHLLWLLRPLRRLAWPRLAVASAALVAGVAVLADQIPYYTAANPTALSATLFDRMQLVREGFPGALCQFLDDNQIVGRAFAAYEWEGLLRFGSPQIRVFIGGRAQAAYDLDTYHRFRAICEHPDEAFRVPPGQPDPLRAMAAPLVILPVADPYYQPLDAYLRRTGDWIPVYADGRNVVLADRRDPVGSRLVEQSRRSLLRYPDAASASLSHAQTLQALGDPLPARFGAFAAAVRADPTSVPALAGYLDSASQFVAESPAPSRPRLTADLVTFLIDQDRILSDPLAHPPGHFTTLAARSLLLRGLLYFAPSDPAAGQWSHDLSVVSQQLGTLNPPPAVS